MASEDDVAGFFTCKAFLLLPSVAVGAELESISTSESVLESESSSVDSSSLPVTSSEERVLLESRWDSCKFTTRCVAFWRDVSLSSLLSSESG